MKLLSVILVSFAIVQLNSGYNRGKDEQVLAFGLSWPIIRFVHTFSSVNSRLDDASQILREEELNFLKADLVAGASLFIAGTQKILSFLKASDDQKLLGALTPAFGKALQEVHTFREIVINALCLDAKTLNRLAKELLSSVTSKVFEAITAAMSVVPERVQHFIKGITQAANIQGKLVTAPEEKGKSNGYGSNLRSNVTECLICTLSGLEKMTADLKNGGGNQCLLLALNEYASEVKSYLAKTEADVSDEDLHFRMFAIANLLANPGNYRCL